KLANRLNFIRSNLLERVDEVVYVIEFLKSSSTQILICLTFFCLPFLCPEPCLLRIDFDRFFGFGMNGKPLIAAVRLLFAGESECQKPLRIDVVLFGMTLHVVLPSETFPHCTRFFI